jgi:hypothetical protein
MNDILGKPPVLLFLGCQADIDSSKSLMTEAATVFAFFYQTHQSAWTACTMGHDWEVQGFIFQSQQKHKAKRF